MKVAMLVLLLAMVVPLISCSPDRVEEEPEPEDATLLTPKPIPELKPVWDDGTITITIGNFKTGKGLAQAMENRRNLYSGIRLMRTLSENVILMSQKKRTVDITVMTLLEAGFEEPVTIEEVRERYRELGYRPLTLEEAVELRLQFRDQPDIETGHRMSIFCVLLSEEETKLMKINPESGSLAIYRNTRRDNMGDGYGIGLFGHQKKVDPHTQDIRRDRNAGIRLNRINETRFACVKE